MKSIQAAAGSGATRGHRGDGRERDHESRGLAENHLGDRDSLDLIGAQDQLIKAIVETAAPTVVFLINGLFTSITL
jgi:beta-glucosidase